MQRRLVVLACAAAVVATQDGKAAAAPGKAASADGWTKGVNEEGKAVQTLKIEAPSMTEEDQYGYNMPDRYRCDSCKAVMFHLNNKLHMKQPKTRNLKAWEYTDLFDETCKGAFEGYGIKLHRGQNVLSGPGLTFADDISPGAGSIQMGGETWNKRLSEICRKIVFEIVGEDEVYERFLSGREEGSNDAIGAGLCISIGHCVTGPDLPPPQKESPEDSKKGGKKDKNKKDSKDKAKAKKDAESLPDRVGIQEYLRSLAASHGVKADEYLRSRTPSDWDKLLVGIAGKLFSKASKPEL